MKNEEFDNQLSYEIAIYWLREMLSAKILNKREFDEIEQVLLQKHSPLITHNFSETKASKSGLSP